MTRHPPRVGRVLRTLGTAAAVALGVVGLVAQSAAALGGIMLGVVVGARWRCGCTSGRAWTAGAA